MQTPFIVLAIACTLACCGCVSTQNQAVSAKTRKASFNAPATARSGSGLVRVATNERGEVASVVIIKSTGSAVLDRTAIAFIWKNWHGPPNARREVPIAYKLPPRA